MGQVRGLSPGFGWWRIHSAAVANLLLIVVDCLRADMVAKGRPAWPRISELAAGGARFDACYSTCPTTTPAVTALLTGRYPSAHGVQGLRGTQRSEERREGKECRSWG